MLHLQLSLPGAVCPLLKLHTQQYREGSEVVVLPPTNSPLCKPFFTLHKIEQLLKLISRTSSRPGVLGSLWTSLFHHLSSICCSSQAFYCSDKIPGINIKGRRFTLLTVSEVLDHHGGRYDKACRQGRRGRETMWRMKCYFTLFAFRPF